MCVGGGRERPGISTICEHINPGIKSDLLVEIYSIYVASIIPSL